MDKETPDAWARQTLARWPGREHDPANEVTGAWHVLSLLEEIETTWKHERKAGEEWMKAQMLAECARKDAEIARLEYAVAHYGEHRASCEWGRSGIPGTSTCTCGFHAAALAEPSAEGGAK
jgi:hypothetical protein